MVKLMGILNLTPDSFIESSRAVPADVPARIRTMQDAGASIIDLGAVSTRPGASPVGLEEEWLRLEPALRAVAAMPSRPQISIDTTRAEIVRRAFSVLGEFIVNDISSGEDDPEMLGVAGSLGLPYVAMHKRGTPSTMDGLCEYPEGIIPSLTSYFKDFERRASAAGVSDWILDPGLGFAKTPEQCWEILYGLEALTALGHPVLIGASDKRFTGGNTALAHAVAILHGASILRLHMRSL
ncbi:MAG: dihydropteroate synthase [Bacteroidia bacterium]|nr:dihydropteroate synthase [Bacteroidia bacterium]